MEKVFVTKIQAELLDLHLNERNDSPAEIVSDYITREWSNKNYSLYSLTLDELIRAVYIGYEIKKSSKELIKDLYDFYVAELESKDFDRMPAGEVGKKVIVDVLEILNIKIEGITKIHK